MKKRRGGRTINYENVELKEQGSKHRNKYLMIQNNCFACEPCSCTVTVLFGPKFRERCQHLANSQTNKRNEKAINFILRLDSQQSYSSWCSDKKKKKSFCLMKCNLIQQHAVSEFETFGEQCTRSCQDHEQMNSSLNQTPTQVVEGEKKQKKKTTCNGFYTADKGDILHLAHFVLYRLINKIQ